MRLQTKLTIRLRPIFAALAGVILFFGYADDGLAATKKKKPSSDDDAPMQSPKATPSLDLPLPNKTSGNGAATPTPPKKTEGAEATPSSKTEKQNAEAKPKPEHAPNATVEPEEIMEFAAQPPRIQQLIRDAVDLTRLNLSYTFGSADPDSGGMDCSGTIYYLLHAHSFNDAPRDSSGQYLWARRR